MNFGSRFKLLLLQAAISVDQFAQVIIGGFIFMIGCGPLPMADETVSSVVGRRSLEGARWAKYAEKFIDFIFAKLGDHDHCRRSIEILSSKRFPD